MRVLAGPHAGRQVVLSRSPITFGRAEDNELVIDLPFVSRHHGELRFENRRWRLVNHSANGTRLDRRWVNKKPRAVADAGTIAIGDQDVLAFTLQPLAADAGEPPPAAPAPRVTGRQKLWIGIGVYLVAMLGLVVFFSTLREEQPQDPFASMAELTDQQIQAEIDRSLPARAPDPRRVQAALEEVNTMLALEETEPDALFRAHEAYQRARAYSPGGRLQRQIDVRNSHVVQRRLTDRVIALYQRANGLLRQRQYTNASNAYRQLLETYPAGHDSRIVQVAEQQWAVTRREADRRR